jgi:hypothetical protein
MFSHIFNEKKCKKKASILKTLKNKEISINSPSKEEEEEKKDNKINTGEINYKDYDKIHSLCMRVIVYFVSKYVIVYDIRT